jgi:RNA polymerase sigma-70 factor (ECF subfamily)
VRSTTGSSGEVPPDSVRIETDRPSAGPGASIVVRVLLKDHSTDVTKSVIVELVEPKGRVVAATSLQNGTATVTIPPECQLGNYSIRVCFANRILGSIPFTVVLRTVAESIRGLLRANLLYDKALAAARESTVTAAVVTVFAEEVERLYVECARPQLARHAREEIFRILKARGAESTSTEAIAQEPARFRPALDLGELYSRYASGLRTFLATHLRAKHKAEDVLHDVFLGLLRHPPLKPVLHPDKYLWRVAWRLVNNSNRQTKRDTEQLRNAALAPAWLHGMSMLSPQDVVRWLDDWRVAARTLEKLTPEERMAVLLARFEHSHEEIAARLGISVEKVRKHVRFGYQALTLSAPPRNEQE